MASFPGAVLGSISEGEKTVPQTCALEITWLLRPKGTGITCEGSWVPPAPTLDRGTLLYSVTCLEGLEVISLWSNLEEC